MTVEVEVCDTCLIAGFDEGYRVADTADIMRSIGDNVAVHRCDEIETDGKYKCGCGCQVPSSDYTFLKFLKNDSLRSDMDSI